jgi:hypothetical protein
MSIENTTFHDEMKGYFLNVNNSCDYKILPVNVGDNKCFYSLSHSCYRHMRNLSVYYHKKFEFLLRLCRRAPNEWNQFIVNATSFTRRDLKWRIRLIFTLYIRKGSYKRYVLYRTVFHVEFSTKISYHFLISY